jgi:hypothetical protein
MKRLLVNIRGSAEWTELQSDDAEVELRSEVQRMRSCGFKVRPGSRGSMEVVNPHTKQVEAMYRLEEIYK